MRRFVTVVFLLLFTIPFGVSISGCSKKSAAAFCAGDTGPLVGQVANISLQPKIFGVSLNFSQIGQVSAPTAIDCKGTAVTVSSFTYATFLPNGQPDMTIADVQPTTGRLCAGTWNRNTGGGIADFTTCNPTNKSGTVYVVANGGGVSSNPLPIFIHPVVTNVTLGPLSTDCVNDPATNCSPAAFDTQTNTCAQTTNGNGCCTVPVPTTATAVAETGCVSQSVTSQLAARVVAGNGANISCQVGHLSYAPQTATIVTIDENGVATAQQPGSTVITANISNAGSSAGFFSTCPPTSIVLSTPSGGGTPTNNIIVNPNNVQPINAVATDKNNTILTGLTLNFESTTPTTIPAGSAASVTPIFPGAAAITAVCQPPTCNPSPFNQIGLFGNGKAVTSNPVLITAPGTNSTNLYIASTDSFYLVPVDFTQPQLGTPIRLPYQPNSMVISDDGSTIYMGSVFELMTFSATTNSLTAQNTTVPGTVLAVSPDGSTLVITDPVRQFVYLFNSSGTIQTQYGGVGTHAVFSPDSTTVYITLGDVTTPATPTTPAVVTPNSQLLVHSTFTGWYQTQTTLPNTTTPLNTTDVAVGVPSVGAFFGGSNTTARSYCPVTTTVGVPPTTSSTTTNLFYPDAGVQSPQTDRIATTNDGIHVLGATVNPTPTLVDLALSHPATKYVLAGTGLPPGECPEADSSGNTIAQTFPTSTVFSAPLPGVTASAITGVFPTSDSKIAFVTYQGSGAVVPTYTPQPTGPGTLGSIPLSTALGTPVAPVSGVVSADNLTFFAGTSGDNAVHLITKQADGTYKDTTTPIAPKLPDVNGNIVAPNLLVQKPRKATS
jgi:trimeric autotransporter adhesin